MTERILTVKEVNSAAAQLCGSASSCSSDLLLTLLFILGALVNEC